MKLCIIMIGMLCLWITVSQVYSKEIGFVETFGLAPDRNEALKQLIPGTEDYYFFNCLHAQHTGNYEQLYELIGLWIKRYGYTDHVKEILNRQALLEYQKHPEKSLDHIKNELNLLFNHEREQSEAISNLPSSLDQNLISISYLTEHAFSLYSNLEGIEDAGLDILDHEQLNPDCRRHFLQRLQRPDIPNLAKLVTDDLAYKHSGGFGSHPIHGHLLKSQLDECLVNMPDLKNNTSFVMTYLTKLVPSNDTDIRTNIQERKNYLLKMWQFVSSLAPVFNSLKAQILYAILDTNRSEGIYDQNLFLEYLKLPRDVSYIHPEYIRRKEFKDVRVNLKSDYSKTTGIPPIDNDESLVRDYLSVFLEDADDYSTFATYIRDDYLKDLFAEIKIVNGIGDKEKWYSLMNPERYKSLKDRIDLDFALTNPRYFSVSSPVELDVFIKNIKTLVVKIFELNAFNYYQSTFQEINTTINLDGLTATYEKVISYNEPPFLRVKRRFSFPEVSAPGVYVIELIGSGKSSRVVIQKGKLYYTERIGASGHEFTVLNERHELCKTATIWLAGREFKPDTDGTIVIPYSTQPGNQKIILKDGSLCSLAEFNHLEENYRLSVGWYVDRESLLKGCTAKVLIRPVLTVNAHPVTLSLLENTRLMIRSEDRDGISAFTEVYPFEVFEDRESVYEFLVPNNLARIELTLKAQVKNISRNKMEDVMDTQEFTVNSIDASLNVEDIFLRRIDRQYVLEILGKNGEIKPDRSVALEMKHRYFRDIIHISLQSDSNGQINLGPLENIEWIQATGAEGYPHHWQLNSDQCWYPSNIHADSLQPIKIPYMGKSSVDRLSISLLEKRMNTWVENKLDAVVFQNGFLEIKGLEPGDYDLFIKDMNHHITIRITKGKPESFFIAGNRILEIKNQHPLQLNVVELSDAVIKVKLENPSEFTRLHVVGTNFVPAFHPFLLTNFSFPEPWVLKIAFPESLYVSGRTIGDEYQYILDRKYADKYPGNMLTRPELLLNPWSIRKTETAVAAAAAGDEYKTQVAESDARMSDQLTTEPTFHAQDSYSNLDFLAQPSVQVLNIKPDKNGMVELDRKLFKNYSQLHLIGVDPINTVYREISLPQVSYAKRDLRLLQQLNPEKHFTEQKQISMLWKDTVLTISDMTTSEFELYDTISKVFHLLSTISKNETLQEFNFILRWHDMTPPEKKEKYTKYACHELNFFLYHKDKPFFSEVILPYISNKKDKTFMDHWLIGNDLSKYLTEWEFSRLNLVEKILVSKRKTGEASRIGRYVKELYDMIPPDIDKFNQLFDIALKGRVLETESRTIPSVQVIQNETESKAISSVKEILELSEKGELDMSLKDTMPSMQMMRKSEPAPLAAPAPSKKDYYKKRQMAMQLEARPFYQKLDKTLEWVENNYYKLPIEAQTTDLIPVNAFWKDFALNDPQHPFISSNFFYATSNFSEMMLALSVLDLPFKADTHGISKNGNALTITAKSPIIVFHKEIKEGQVSEEKIPMLVRQNIFNPKDRYRFEDNERFDKFIDEECLVRTPYGAQVVVSNPTSSPQKLRILLQIPKGAMPLNSGFYTKGVPVTLEPFSTRTIEYFFYFPEIGKFSVYPVQISKKEVVIGNGNAIELSVVPRLTKLEYTSWDHISQNGTDNEVLEYLKTSNLNRLNLEKIAFRMKNKGFFQNTIKLLQERYFYHPTLWSYSIYHNIPELISEYLKHTDYADHCGMFIETPLLTINPVARKTYDHREYRPLVNARIHPLGQTRKILNDRFYDQYHKFMKYLCYRPNLTQEDMMAVVYYLLLQDRLKEAILFFEKIDRNKIEEQIQYDYLKIYIDFYRQDLASARQIIARYQDYPVLRWQNLFKEAAAQLEEAEGKKPDIVDQESREQVQAKLAVTEPVLELSVVSKKITIRYQNIRSCILNYYPMDIELLFSRNPFVQQQIEYFAYIRPSVSSTIDLPEKQTSVVIDLPQEFHNSNLMVEAISGGLRKSQAYYSNSLDIQVIENYGYLKVVHQQTQQPLPKVYVKVYARLKDKSVIFYKDGYTDVRGRFDYISINTNELDITDRFAILVISDEFGAAIRESSVPKR